VASALSFDDITQVIQLAIAPVFLLASVGTFLGVLTSRLGRSVDRGRVLASVLAQLDPGIAPIGLAEVSEELAIIERRIAFIYVSIFLDVACALLIAFLVAIAFIDALVDYDYSSFIAALFVLAMVALIGSLMVFMREIFLAVTAPRSPVR
jgi:hypothetical protein